MSDQETQPKPRRGVHPLLAWPAIYALAVFVAAWLYHFTGRDAFAPWFLLAVVPVVGMAGTAIGSTVWKEEVFGRRQADDASTLAWATGVATGAWMVWAGHVGPPRAWSVWALVALLLALWWWAVGLRAPRRRAAQEELTGRLAGASQDREWREILDAADCGDIVLTGKREHRAGMTFTCEPDPERKKMATYADFAARADRIAVQAASRARRAGRPLPPNAVRPEPGADDAEFLLNVTTRDVFTSSTEYVPDYSPGDITRALDVGEFEDAARLLMDLLAGHWKIVGASGSGKTNLANNIIGRASACSNALVWVCATDKLIPLVYPWVKPFFEGTTTQPTLDWVAGKDVGQVLRMLRGAYRLACERNDRLADEAKMRATSREPAVIVIVEETSHAVEFVDTITTHDGQEVTVSDLLKMVAQAGRSANVRLIVMSQYGLNAGLGDRAPELMRNLTGRVCLRTMEPYDGYRTLPALPSSVNTTALANYTMYLQSSIDVPRAVPGKASELEGSAMIGPVATRNAGWRPAGVESESDLGPDYACRWASARLPELAAAVSRAGLQWRTPGQTAPIVGVATGPARAGEDVQVELGDDDGGAVVDTTEQWTEADDAAWADLLGGGEPEKPRPFQLPDPGVGIARLRRFWDPTRPVPEPVEDDDDRPAEAVDYPAGDPLPKPLADVVAWLDLKAETVGWEPEWVRTEEAAIGIGWGPDRTVELGRKLSRLGLESRNLPREVDPQRRRGYAVEAIREVATRHRFGL